MNWWLILGGIVLAGAVLLAIAVYNDYQDLKQWIEGHDGH